MYRTFNRPRLRYMSQPGTEGTPGPSGTPPAPENTPSGTPDGKEPDDGGKGSKQAVLADLAKERDARQTLEQTVAQMQQAQKDQMAAIATALGVKPDAKDDGSQLLSTLQQQVADMQRESLVFRIAAAHSLTKDEDIEFLKSAKDEESMGKLAARLAANAEATPGTPKPDLSQGGKDNSGTKPDVKPGMARLRQAYSTPSQ